MTVTKKVITYHTGGASLKYNTVKLNNIDMFKALCRGEKVFVELSGYPARAGSIGIVSLDSARFYVPIYKSEKEYNSDSDSKNTYKRYLKYDAYLQCYMSNLQPYINLDFGNGRKLSSVAINSGCVLTYLENYTGPTNYVYDRTKIVKEIKPVKPKIFDIFGVEPKLNDVISVSADNELWLGNIIEINKDGSQFKANLVSKQKKNRKKAVIRQSEKFMIITDDIKDKILIYKLSN